MNLEHDMKPELNKEENRFYLIINTLTKFTN